MNRYTTFPGFRIGLAVLCLTAITAQAQLAITEAMSSEADTFTDGGVTNSVTPNSDFWELTNFGTNDIDLTGYKMADEGAGLGGAYSAPFDGLTIGPGETIVFVQDSVNTNEQSFRDWWGPSLPATTRIIFYHNYGLSSSGDGMSLWDPSDSLVDHAHVGAATRGISFTYDPTTGEFGVLSTNAEGGAFKAATTDDVGSPGITAGIVHLALAQPPASLVVTSGFSATFSANAVGLPRAKFQWQFNGSPIANATDASLVIPSATTNDAGTYRVIVTNGVETVTSTNVTLTVYPAATAPAILSAPRDLAAYIGQNASFSVQSQGNPAPSYQWSFNGAPLTGQTTNQLVINGLAVDNSGTYGVLVSNTAGATNLSANLLVTRKPNLVITEVQTSEAAGAATNADWWELSNFDDFAVDLFGYRWDDNSANLGVAYTITNHVIIHPGESIVLVETSAPGVMTAQKFKYWWGESNLPPNLQIIVYGGNGLGLSASSDQVNLWNQATTIETDPIGKVAAVQLSTSPVGRTFIRDPDTGIFSGNSTTGLSTNGINGAFTAAFNGDVGSPGWVVDPLRLQLTPNGPGYDLTWNSTAGRSYTVFFKHGLLDAVWTSMTNVVASGSTTAVTDPAVADTRLYRVAVTVH